MTASKTAAGPAARGGADTSKFICNVVPSEGTENDWRFDDSIASGAADAPAAPPASVDLRAPWWSINNQESTGSCVGWATADGLVRYHLVKAGRIGQSDMLSPRYVWMASKETDTITTRPGTFIEQAGTTLKAAVDITRKYGAALETELPFHILTNMFAGNENVFYASCAQRRIASYFNLRKNLQNWKSWLAAQGPILAALNVDASWDKAASNGGNVDTFQPETVRGGHAIAIVGYRSDGRFIARNSWGTAWGDQGFGYLSPSYISAAFFNESYGITI
jgi:C1A family cysteine protease